MPALLGISFSDDGFSLNASLGIELGDFQAELPASVILNPDDWAKVELSPEVRWGNSSIGLDAGIGLSPV